MSKRLLTSKYMIMAAVLFASAASSLMLGSAKLSVSEIFTSVLRNSDSPASVILFSVRLPRMMAAILAGWGLSVSGVLLQNVTNNDLASPNIIGVNSGAGFCAILLLAFFPAAVSFTAPAAFAGALLATLIIIGISVRLGGSKSTVILAGMALTAILNAAISFVSLIDTDTVAVYNYFSIGGLSGISASRLIIPACFILISHCISLLISPDLNTLCLGDELATSLGVKVKSVRRLCLILASASAAAVVSFAGLLGFVGLIVPHIARTITGHNTTRLLISAPIIGASLVLLADMLGRIVLAPTEIPVGIIMAVLGAPFFLILLFRRGGRA